MLVGYITVFLINLKLKKGSKIDAALICISRMGNWCGLLKSFIFTISITIG